MIVVLGLAWFGTAQAQNGWLSQGNNAFQKESRNEKTGHRGGGGGVWPVIGGVGPGGRDGQSEPGVKLYRPEARPAERHGRPGAMPGRLPGLLRPTLLPAGRCLLRVRVLQARRPMHVHKPRQVLFCRPIFVLRPALLQARLGLLQIRVLSSRQAPHLSSIVPMF